MLRIHVLGELVVETSAGPVELDRLVARPARCWRGSR